MSSTITSSDPNSIKPFDVRQVLETLRPPLEALNGLIDANTVEARRKRLRNLSTPTESSQAVAQENPYRGKALQTILSENFSEPIDQNDFLATVKQIKDTCIKHEISDNYSLFEQLKKLHSTGINSTDKQPYARLKEELRLGIIATGAKEVLGKLAAGGHTEQENNLVKVLKLIEQELLKPSSVPVDQSLVEQFELEPTTNSSGKYVDGRRADRLLSVSLGDQKLAQLQQHDVRIFLETAQDWRGAGLTQEQSADNGQSKETSAKNRITDFFSRRLF
jgi:hypothetical protein